MFKRLTDRVSSALGTTSSTEEKVQTLQAMGFSQDQARGALESTDGDVDRAAELLLASNTGGAAPTHDEALENALQESLQTEEDRQYRQAHEASVAQRPPQRSAAVTRAGEAAAQRAAQASQKFGTADSKAKTKAKERVPPPPRNKRTPSVGVGGSFAHHHPNVKVPPKLQDKSKVEQVMRCADRLKPYPLAVDTLYRALSAVQKDPGNDKYRKIDKTTPGYKRSLEGVPGAEALLIAMNFHTRGPYSLVLERHLVDSALIYLGVSALEGAKESNEYIEAKKAIVFAKEIKAIQMESNESELEAVKRAKYIAKCPALPPSGRGALMQIVIADETIRRRFDGDDVLRDILHWIGGHGSVIPEKILSREWCLVDLNRYPIAPIDCDLNADKTLQYLGCWPSGRLEIRPSPETWKNEGSNGNLVMGSARGLGAAPREALH